MSSRDIVISAAGASGYWFGATSFGTESISSGSTILVKPGDDNSIFICDADMRLVKIDKSGIIQYTKALSGYTNYTKVNSMAISNSGEVYLFGMGGVDSLYGAATVTKFSSNGTYEWSKYMTVPIGSSGAQYQAGAVSPNGNIIAVGHYYTNTQYRTMVSGFTSSGTTVFNSGAYGTDEVTYGVRLTGLVVDGSNNIYVTGQNTGVSQAGITYGWYAEYSSNGSRTGSYRYAITGGDTTALYGLASGIATGSYGYGASTAFATNFGWAVAILNKSSTDKVRLFMCASDNLGYKYVAGDVGNTPYDHTFFIAKFSSSGTLQWQRKITYNGGASATPISGISFDSKNDMYISGRGMIARLPSDGSLTGTYGPWTYSATDYTVSTKTGSLSSLSVNTGGSLINNSITLTQSTPTLTNTVTNI